MPDAQGFDFLEDRDLALTIGCRYCGAKVGELCTAPAYSGERHPLEHFPAHQTRTARAKRLQRMRQLDDVAQALPGGAANAIPPAQRRDRAPHKEIATTSMAKRSESK